MEFVSILDRFGVATDVSTTLRLTLAVPVQKPEPGQKQADRAKKQSNRGSIP